jgi:hypothetical protein
MSVKKRREIPLQRKLRACLGLHSISVAYRSRKIKIIDHKNQSPG